MDKEKTIAIIQTLTGSKNQATKEYNAGSYVCETYKDLEESVDDINDIEYDKTIYNDTEYYVVRVL